ncbi:hypothetical protein KFK09_011171 [Dendrobium nobile]|uniref:CCHC-type domain-containing protein n=1 Tax=Dendrobium nobile TaxID=94219 RepID=A0A8T3BC44_DENNO|nr:hypothetical protein KFK09_011171 [Dendrobium nobile]
MGFQRDFGRFGLLLDAYESLSKRYQEMSSATSNPGEQLDGGAADQLIPATLKFVVTNLRTLVHLQLQADNYSLWRAQIAKIFRANRFEKFLEPSSLSSSSDSSSTLNPKSSQWTLMDQNLAAAICSTISTSILPYIVNLESTAKIWSTLETRFQASNRSKVIQLKNSLHNVALKNQSVTQYLTEIKTLVDQISASGSSVDNEDVILYILNGLPQSYQSFKTAIRTMLNPISLDQLYPLLLSEEINIAADLVRSAPPTDTHTALFVPRSRGRRARGRNYNNVNTSTRSQPNPNANVICQICSKKGHAATTCWHRLDQNYGQSHTTDAHRALAAQIESNPSNWYLDSGSTSHLTSSLDNMSNITPYQGSDMITVGDGRSVNIANTGNGLLPTPSNVWGPAPVDSVQGYRYYLKAFVIRYLVRIPQNKTELRNESTGMHVTFQEDIFPFSLQQDKQQAASADLPPLLLVPNSTTASNITTKLSNNISTSSLNSNLTSSPALPELINHTNANSDPQIQQQIPHPMITRTRTGKLKPVIRMNLLHTQEASTSSIFPSNYTEAVQHQHWRTTMANEFLALQQQGTWSLVPPPPNISILGCRWTYHTKFNSDGSIAKYKARLVAQGHRQEFGLDYNETFSPVVKLPTIRIMLAIALSNNWQQAGLLNCNPASNPTCTKIPDNPKPNALLSDPEVYRRIADADWAGDPSSRKSTSGFCSFLGKNSHFLDKPKHPLVLRMAQTTATSTATSTSPPSPAPADLSANLQDNLSTTSIPSSLKFLMQTIKNVITQPLTSDNHALWRSQVIKLFRANGYEGFLTGSISRPPPLITDTSGQTIKNLSHDTWVLIDQNLAAALYSVINPSILPYVLSLDHCVDIWKTLDLRLQCCTRLRISQLKNELHFLSMKEHSMTQYLLEVKTKVDALAAAGAPVEVEDIIHYTLNGLPNNYQAFKTAIRTNLRSVSLDELYTLLCSEELNLAHETSKDLRSLQLNGNSTALAASQGRGRGRTSSNRGRSSNRSTYNTTNNRNNKPPRPQITCQICGKFGHSAIKCWHRHNEDYNTEPTSALFTSPSQTSSSKWFLDSGASAHLTSDPNQLQQPQPYQGSNQIVLGNGQQLPIQNTGKGILLMPSGSLQLANLNIVPNLAFNLLFVHKLTTDNNCLITFSSNGYEIKDRKNHRLLRTGPVIDGLYPLKAADHSDKQLALLSVQHIPDLWHRRLGHPSNQALRISTRSHNEVVVPLKTNTCNSCKMAKSHRLHKPLSQTTSTFPFSLVHSDVWGPFPMVSNRI